jgi:hypothetical protein
MSIRLTPNTLMLAIALAGGSAQAQQTWNLVANGNTGGMCAQASANQNTYDNSYSCNNGSSNVTVSAWSTDRGAASVAGGSRDANGNLITANTTQAGTSPVYTSGNGAGTTFANAFLTNQGTSGFGAANRSEGLNPGQPNHAFDSIPNDPNRVELMLLDFGSTNVVLNNIGIGWKNGTGTGDMTVMRWVGAKPAASTSAVTVGGNETLAAQRCTGGLVTGCWSLVGSYADVPADPSSPYGDVNTLTNATTAMASSWWMISTFNTALNGNSTTCRNATNTGNATCSEGNDAFKINFIRATTAQVPVTGSLALAGLGLLAAFMARRRAAV